MMIRARTPDTVDEDGRFYAGQDSSPSISRASLHEVRGVRGNLSGKL